MPAELTIDTAIADLERIAHESENQGNAADLIAIARLLREPKSIVIAGNPVDGFTYIGPLTSESLSETDSHDIEALTDERGGYWWIVELEPANDFIQEV